MPRDGYNAVRWMRERSPDKRGGNEKPADGFTRGGPTLAAYLDEYLEWMKIRNRTDEAIEGRRVDLKVFFRWTEERSLIYPDQISRSILESYQRWLFHYRKKNGKPLGVSTQYSYLGAVKYYFAWLCKQRVLEANPASEIELPRPDRRLPVEALSIPEMESILAQPDISDPLGIRDRAIMEVFYSTGIRRAELVRLELSDLNRDKRLLHIRLGKCRKDRVVPVGMRAMRWLEKYLDDVRPLLTVNVTEPALFLTGYGEKFNANVLGRLVIKYIEKANIGRRGGPHLFRHTCATHMLEGGADIRYIQQLLGHEKLETTAIYTEVSIIQLQAVHARCHPAERSEAPRPFGAAERHGDGLNTPAKTEETAENIASS
jgi:integrase/recombinase XerD